MMTRTPHRHILLFFPGYCQAEIKLIFILIFHSEYTIINSDLN